MKKKVNAKVLILGSGPAADVHEFLSTYPDIFCMVLNSYDFGPARHNLEICFRSGAGMDVLGKDRFSGYFPYNLPVFSKAADFAALCFCDACLLHCSFSLRTDKNIRMVDRSYKQ